MSSRSFQSSSSAVSSTQTDSNPDHQPINQSRKRVAPSRRRLLSSGSLSTPGLVSLPASSSSSSTATSSVPTLASTSSQPRQTPRKRQKLHLSSSTSKPHTVATLAPATNNDKRQTGRSARPPSADVIPPITRSSLRRKRRGGTVLPIQPHQQSLLKKKQKREDSMGHQGTESPKNNNHNNNNNSNNGADQRTSTEDPSASSHSSHQPVIVSTKPSIPSKGSMKAKAATTTTTKTKSTTGLPKMVKSPPTDKISQDTRIADDVPEESPVVSALSVLEGLFAAALSGSSVRPGLTTSAAAAATLKPDRRDSSSGVNSDEVDSRAVATSSENSSHPANQLAAWSSLLNSVMPTGSASGNAFLASCFERHVGGGSHWMSKVSELESTNIPTQSAALKELVDWLTYSNEDTLNGFPLERVVAILIDVLAGRSFQGRRSKIPLRRRLRKNCDRKNSEDWIDVSSSVVFGLGEEQDQQPDESGAASLEDDDTKSRQHQTDESVSHSKFESGRKHSEDNDDDDEATAAVGDHMIPNEFETISRKVDAASCLHFLLELSPVTARLIASLDGIEVLCQQLQHIEYIDLAERIVLALQQIASEVPNKLLEKGGLKAMLDFVDFFPLPVQRTVVKASCALVARVETIKEYKDYVQTNLGQIGSLLNRDDEHILQTVCQSFRRMVDFIDKEDINAPGLAKESFDYMNEKGLVLNLLNLMKRSIAKENDGGSFLSHDYLYCLDVLYILSALVFHSHSSCDALLSENLIQLVFDLYSAQTSGQHSLLTLRALGLLTSILPAVSLSSDHKKSIIETEKERTEYFSTREEYIAFLCTNFNHVLLRSHRLPTSGETIRLSLAYLLSLTTLIRTLSETSHFSSTLPSIFLEGLNSPALASFLYSIISMRTSSIQVPQKIPNKLPTIEDKASLTMTLSSLLIATHVAEFEPSRHLSLWRKFGLVDVTLHLSGVSGSDDDYLESFKDVEEQILTTALSKIEKINHEKNSNHQQSLLFFNISNLIRLAACRFGRLILSSISQTEGSSNNMTPIRSPVVEEAAFSLPDIAMSLKAAALHHHDYSLAKKSFLDLRFLLLDGFRNGPESISAYELQDSGLIHSLCHYLFGGCLYKSNNIIANHLNETYETRISLFIQTLGTSGRLQTTEFGKDNDVDIITTTTNNIWNEWKQLGKSAEPIDLRPILLLCRLCVAAMGQAERFPCETYTKISNSPAFDTGKTEVQGCLPRHLHPNHLKEVSKAAKSIFGRKACELKKLDDDNKNEGELSMLEGSNHQTNQKILLKPQSLFSHLTREIKVFARCEVGPIVKCSLWFPPLSTTTESSADVIAQTQTDMKLFDRLTKLSTTLPLYGMDSIEGLKAIAIGDPQTASPIQLLNTQERIVFILQLSVDFRTTCHLLEQSLRSVVEKQLVEFQKQKRKERQNGQQKEKGEDTGKKGQESEKDEGIITDDGITKDEQVIEDDEIINGILNDADGAEGKIKTTEVKQLYLSVNGHLIPPRMTIGEALCRFANKLAVDAYSLHHLSKGPKGGVSGIPSKTNQFDVLDQSDDEITDTESIGIDDDVLETYDLSGVWISCEKSKRFFICSKSEEWTLAVEIRDSRSNRPSAINSPLSDTSAAAGPRLNLKETATEADGEQPSIIATMENHSEANKHTIERRKKRSLWCAEHSLQISIGSVDSTEEKLASQMNNIKKLSGYYIDERVPEGNEILYVDNSVKNGASSNDAECLYIRRVPSDARKEADGSIIHLPSGDRLLSIDSILSYLALKQTSQLFCINELPSAILDLDGNSSNVSKRLDQINPIALLQRFVSAMSLFDCAPYSSPIVTNTLISRFSHLSLYQSFLNDFGIQIPFQENQYMAPQSWTVTNHTVDRVQSSAISYLNSDKAFSWVQHVQEQMLFASGSIDSWLGRDSLLAAGLYDERCHESSLEEVESTDSFENECEGIEEDDEDEEAGECLDEKDSVDDEDHLHKHFEQREKDLKEIQYKPPNESLIDILDDNIHFAKLVQLVLLFSQIIDVCMASNRCIELSSPEALLSDATALSPLYFPSKAQLRASFSSSQLTVKVVRQLADPIAIASAKLPRWLTALASLIPRLFPINLRKHLLLSTAGGAFFGLANFKRRIREIGNNLGVNGSNGRDFRLSTSPQHSSFKVTQHADVLMSDGNLPFSGIEEADQNDVSSDAAMHALARDILGIDESNKRRQRQKLTDLEQALAPQRAKIRLARNQVMESANRALEYFHSHNTCSSIPAIMEIEYFGEEGVGSGPTLEFYSEILERLRHSVEPKLFREEVLEGNIFPQPYAVDCLRIPPSFLKKPDSSKLMTTKSPETGSNVASSTPNELADPIDTERSLFTHFKLLGQLFAKSVLDSRLIDMPLHPIFWKLVTSTPASWSSIAQESALAQIDFSLYRQLCGLRNLKNAENSLEDLAIYFVLPGSTPEIELIPNGKQCLLNNNNLEEFIQAVCDWTVWRGVALQAWAFRFGVASLMPLSSLTMFAPAELTNSVTGGISTVDNEEFWSLEHLKKFISPDHGFAASSPPFINFIEAINEFSLYQRKQFLKFCTGTTVLPHGGFARLKPPMKVVRKENWATADGKSVSTDDTLPSVMACTNYVKLPPYSTKSKLKEKLLIALEEGQGAFTLS